MTNPSDHELERVLARVAEVEIAEFRPGEWYCVANPADIASGSMRWNPLHDANQMELVEEAVTKTMDIEYTKYVESKIWGVSAWNAKRQFDGADVSRKRALAIAVYAMEQAQKGMT